MGDITNLKIARLKGVRFSSTGAAEEGGQIIIKTMTSNIGTIQHRTWSALKKLLWEVEILDQLFENITITTQSAASSAKASTKPVLPDDPVQSGSDPPQQQSQSEPMTSKEIPEKHPQPTMDDKDVDMPTDSDMPTEEVFSIIQEAMQDEEQWEAVKYILEETTLLINTDTGGQAEFMDLHGALVQGPSFNLLFSRLVDHLDRLFKVGYTKDGISRIDEESTMTAEEVIFQALAGIACFSGCFSGGVSASSEGAHKLSAGSKSKVMFVGTHRDLVTDSQFKEKDCLLQQKIKSSAFYDKNVIEFASEDQLMLAVDNWSGDQDEIDGIRKVLEKVIEKNFEKVPIPAAWLMLSLYIRKKGCRTMTLAECENHASKVGIDPEELQVALWFLHHRIGLLLYYPEIESLQGTVICKIQVLFDSATNLVTNIFTFDKVGKAASEKFREKAQFSLEEVKEAMSCHTDDLIPLEKLVELLQHLNILTVILMSRADSTTERNFFMPCVLRSARASDLSVPLKLSDPAPLMLRYECGYVPMGVFPAMITNLVSQRLEDWHMIDEGLRKNKVAFYVGEDCDTVTLLSHPCYIEIAISRNPSSTAPAAIEWVCGHVRDTIKSTLHTVTTSMNDCFNMEYQFGFECPKHPGRDHLCVLTRVGAKNMQCLENFKNKVPVPLQSHHRVWFEDTSKRDDVCQGRYTLCSALE